MEYKLYNSNTLKSVQINEDTSLIFELTKANNTKVFLNTLLYSSQYGCPISFSLIRDLNSTKNIGFGAGAVLDFMYELSVAAGKLIIKHPTGETEDFVYNQVTVNYPEEYKEIDYFYSTTTTSFIKRIKDNGTITKYYYINASLTVIFNSSLGVPDKYSRNGTDDNQCVNIIYNSDKSRIIRLENNIDEKEKVEFLYYSDKVKITGSKKFNKNNFTVIDKISVDFGTGKIDAIETTMHEKTTPIRKTLFTFESNFFSITNDITKLSTKVTLLNNAVTSIQFKDNASSEIEKLSITYIDNYETKVQYNGMWEKYFFDYNYNLQHIENSVGQVKTFQYDNTQRRLLLSQSDLLYAKNVKNTSNILPHTSKEINSYNGYVFEGDGAGFHGLPSGYYANRVTIYETYEDEEAGFTFRYNKSGKRFDVENLVLWYKLITCPENAGHNDIQAYLYFYKGSSTGDVLIRTEPILMNTTIQKKWLFNILAAQAAEDYDYVDIYFSVNKPGYVMDISVELMSDSFVNIYKYDDCGRIVETLSEKQIQKYKYNEDNQMIGSSVCIMSYDENGNPDILVTANNIQQETTRDNFGNITSQIIYNRNKNRFIKSTRNYTDNEHFTSENTEKNDLITYLYDDKKRFVSSVFQNYKSTITYSSNDDSNYGKASKLMHSYRENIDYNNLGGSQTNYNNDGTIKNVYHLNLASAPDYIYNYEYDSQQRIIKISLGNREIVSFLYLKENNTKTKSVRLHGNTITYNYDENERLLSKVVTDNDGSIKVSYSYTYDDNTTILKSIVNNSTSESYSFDYDGQLIKSILSGNFNLEYGYNNDKTALYEKKYYNNNLISIDKQNDNTLLAKKDNILKFELDVANNENGNVYQTNFTKKTKKNKFNNETYIEDITKSLSGFYGSDVIENSSITPSNNKYGFDGLSYLSFTSGDSPLLYKFINHESAYSNWNGLGLKYTVFFGFKLESFDTSKPILQICNNSNSMLDRILLYATSNSLKLHLYNSNTNTSRQETFNINYRASYYNFVALNVTMDTNYKYTVEVYLNGDLLGGVNDVLLTNAMNEVYIFGNAGERANIGKISNVIIKRIGHISMENIKLYTMRLFDINKIKGTTLTQYNKKSRLSTTTIPMIIFDNTFESMVGNIKPHKLSYNANYHFLSDYFTFDSDDFENVMVLRKQTLSYDFNLSDSGIAGVRFKRVEGHKTCIFTLDNDKISIDVSINSLGEIIVKINSITFNPNVSLNLLWNNIFIKWERVIASGSIEDFVYKFTLSVNETSYLLCELEFTDSLSKVILSLGKSNLDADDTIGCFGYIEKAVWCTTNTLLSTLNTMFNGNKDEAINIYDDLGQKEKRNIITSNSSKIEQEFSYDVSDEGRLLGKLVSDIITLKTNSVIKNVYTYNLDKTIKIQKTTNSTNNTETTKTYTYDKKVQLQKLIDATNTYEYTYDNMGNITQIKKNNSVIHTATYTNGILLNTVNGYTISYDSSGYPIAKKSGTVDIERYTWIGGKLESFEYVQQQRKIVFTYAENGLRTSKKEYQGTTLCNTTNYYYNAAGLLAYETRTLNNINLEYLYDAEGSLYCVYYNGTPYYYIKDALGTITHLVDSNRNIVTRFDYDGAYGKHSAVDVNSVGSTHITFINPFRYKGYYYDVETQLYWVSSRYYSPELCRWISPDSIEYLDPSSINGLNLYAYCNNDPVNKYDPTGHFPWLVLAAFVFVGITRAAANAIGQYQSTGQIDWFEVAVEGVYGGVMGALTVATAGTFSIANLAIRIGVTALAMGLKDGLLMYNDTRDTGKAGMAALQGTLKGGLIGLSSYIFSSSKGITQWSFTLSAASGIGFGYLSGLKDKNQEVQWPWMWEAISY